MISKNWDSVVIVVRNFDTMSESWTMEQMFRLDLQPFELELRQNCLQN